MPVWDSTIATSAGDVRVSDTGGRFAPIVLIHGSGASRGVFSRQMESSLQDDHRLIAFDLPGHGESADSTDPERDYSVTGLAAITDEVLRAAGVTNPVVFGWSLGGHVAIELMALRKDLAGVMLTGTPPLSPGPLGMLRGFQTNLDLLLASKDHFSDRDAERFFAMCFHGAGEERFLDSIRRADGRLRAVFSRSLMRGDGANQKRTVERATIPVAIVNGAQDTVARLSYLEQLDYRNLWSGQCHVIADAGHAPFWDQPAVFNRLLAQFAADAKAGAGAVQAPASAA